MKALLTIGIVTLFLMAPLYLITRNQTFEAIERSEKDYSLYDAQRFVNNLQIELNSVDQIVNDWASWDDTYKFVHENGTEYKDSNLVDQTLQNLNVNFIYYFDTSNQLVYGKTHYQSYDVHHNSSSILKTISGNPSLFIDNIDGSMKGLIIIEGKAILVASHPILTSLKEGPIRGTLIMGRCLDQSELNVLYNAVGLPLSIQIIGNPSSSSDFMVAASQLSKQQPLFASTLNETIMAGYTLIEDVSGNPILIARVEDYRAAYAQGKDSMMYTLLSFAAIGIIIVAAIEISLHKQVISRISLLNNTITNIRKTGDHSKRVNVTSQDELSSLGKNLNSMLDVIEENTENLEKEVNQRTKDLFENQEKLKALINASPDAIIAIDLKGIIMDCNIKMTGLSGFSKDELLNKEASKFINEEDRENIAKKTAKLLRGECDIIRIECSLLKKDQTYYDAEVSINVLRDVSSSPSGLVVIVRDLTEKKLLEQRLFDSERLAAIGQLAGMVGHDLRNPLQGINNAAYFLRRKQASAMDDNGIKMLNSIDKAVSYANKIVNDLLDYSRALNLELEDCQAKAIVNYAIMSLNVPKDIGINQEIEDISLKLDSTKMQRVFINLIKNAIEAMPSGGNLRIKGFKKGDNYILTFADTGTGMSSDVQEKLFSPLITTKAQGMGFGLAICKRIVDAHGGTISVKSLVGAGTIFTITLPIDSRNQTIQMLMPALNQVTSSTLLES